MIFSSRTHSSLLQPSEKPLPSAMISLISSFLSRQTEVRCTRGCSKKATAWATTFRCRLAVDATPEVNFTDHVRLAGHRGVEDRGMEKTIMSSFDSLHVAAMDRLHERDVFDIDAYGWLNADDHDPDLVGYA